MQRILIFASLIFFTGVVLDSCVTHDLDPAPVTCGDTLTLKDDIYPLILLRCAVDGCHASSNPDLPHWADTTVFKANIVKVRTRVGAGEMPKDNATHMTEDERAMMVCWADAHIN
jgi:hypothetical protein